MQMRYQIDGFYRSKRNASTFGMSLPPRALPHLHPGRCPGLLNTPFQGYLVTKTCWLPFAYYLLPFKICFSPPPRAVPWAIEYAPSGLSCNKNLLVALCILPLAYCLLKFTSHLSPSALPPSRSILSPASIARATNLHCPFEKSGAKCRPVPRCGAVSFGPHLPDCLR